LGWLTEIRGGYLRFNAAEAGAFLRDVVGCDVRRRFAQPRNEAAARETNRK
jgi:hypothetical protein